MVIPAHSGEFSYETYDINTQKTIGDGSAISIEYINSLPEDGDQKDVTLKGVIIINPLFVPINLEVDYYVMDGEGKIACKCPLDIEASPNQNIYTFSVTYPLDITMYEYELFSIALDVGLRDTNPKARVNDV